jgi:predicted membrane protein
MNEKRNGNIALGALILVIGSLLLFRQMGFFIPRWIFSWPMILIAIGAYTGYTNRFRNIGSVILIFIGGFFLLRDMMFLPYNLAPFLFPVALILLGFYIIFRRRENKSFDLKGWEKNFDKIESADGEKPGEGVFGKDGSSYLKVDAFLTGIKRKVMSKDFRGGEITTLFGGSDIDLMHADIKGQAVLKVSVAFGGLKLVVPSNWDVQLGVSNLAAGIDDKRYTQQGVQNPDKKLIVTGSVVFGGIEISSY